MPRRFLSQAERAQLSRFPPDISDNDCIVYFRLTPADIEAIQRRREAHNHLGFAMQLCALRYLGYFPADIREPPQNILDYVADQLGLPAEAITDYALRVETRREHLSEVMQHLGFRRMRAGDRKGLVSWLGERALENEHSSRLLQLACERLYQLQLVRPATTSMEDLVADARQWAQQKTYQILAQPLPAESRERLDTLFERVGCDGLAAPRGEDPRAVALVWLRRAAVGHNADDILEALDKLAFVRKWAVENWDLSDLPPCRLKHLAQIARRTSVQGLERRQPAEKREAMLIAFLLGHLLAKGRKRTLRN